MTQSSEAISALQPTLDEEHATELVAHRTRLRKPLTAFAAKLLAKRLALFVDPNRACEVIIERAWLSIEPDWRHGLQLASEARQTSGAAQDRVKLEMGSELWNQFPGAFQGKDGAKWVSQQDVDRARGRLN